MISGRVGAIQSSPNGHDPRDRRIPMSPRTSQDWWKVPGSYCIGAPLDLNDPGWLPAEAAAAHATAAAQAPVVSAPPGLPSPASATSNSQSSITDQLHLARAAFKRAEVEAKIEEDNTSGLKRRPRGFVSCKRHRKLPMRNSSALRWRRTESAISASSP